MKLSAEQFADLAASFPGYSGDRPKRERRRAARLDLHAQLTIHLLRDERASLPTTVTVTNFSPRGLALLVREPLAIGTQIVTELARQSGGQITFLCTVMHSRPVAGGMHHVGVEFTRVLWQHVAESPIEQIADALRRMRGSHHD